VFHPFVRLPYLIGRSASLDMPYHASTSRIKTLFRERVRRVMLDREILI
jgi:hypothetical protein